MPGQVGPGLPGKQSDRGRTLQAAGAGDAHPGLAHGPVAVARAFPARCTGGVHALKAAANHVLMCVSVRLKRISPCILKTDLFVLITKKGNIMKASKNLMALCAAGMMVVALAACQKKEDVSAPGPAEQAGQKIDAAAAQANSDIKDAAAKADAAVSQAASDTGAKIDQVTADANKKMNEAADAVGQKVEKAGEKIQDAAHK